MATMNRMQTVYAGPSMYTYPSVDSVSYQGKCYGFVDGWNLNIALKTGTNWMIGKDTPLLGMQYRNPSIPKLFSYQN